MRKSWVHPESIDEWFSVCETGEKLSTEAFKNSELFINLGKGVYEQSYLEWKKHKAECEICGYKDGEIEI